MALEIRVEKEHTKYSTQFKTLPFSPCMGFIYHNFLSLSATTQIGPNVIPYLNYMVRGANKVNPDHTAPQEAV